MTREAPISLTLPTGASRPEPTDRGTVTFIGTATVLVQLGGFTFLTDPNFLHAGDHAHLGYGLRSERTTDPAMELDDLPPLDFVLLSHHHGDHFDQVVIERLRKDIPIITEPHSARKLHRQGFERAVPLRTWEAADVHLGQQRLRITAMPGRHAPRALQPMLPKVMGSLLEFCTAGQPTDYRMYITGDTLHIPELAEIPRRFPDIDLCLIHLGGTRIGGVLLTMDGAQGVRTLRLVRPDHAIPIHFDDYTVFRSRLSEFRVLAEQQVTETELHYLDRGESYVIDLRRTGYRTGMNEIRSGTVLTCANPDCGCELEVRQPCPHGDTYTCACGHPLRPGEHEQTLAERVEELGIVDQQSVLVDDACEFDER